jgi:hypothetical protein
MGPEVRAEFSAALAAPGGKLTMNAPKEPMTRPMKSGPESLANESGRIGYVIAWLLGVPASVLFFIFLIRGH